MKKFMTLAAMFAAVMMSFSSCEKPDNGGTNNGGNETPADVCPDCQKNPCECEPEYVSPITIDGDFADWDGLDASKVSVATCNADAKWTALKTLKVYADEVYVNFLIEVDADQVTADAPIDIYLNSDGDETEGDNNWLSQSAMDYLLEGAYFAEGAVVSLDAGLFTYAGAKDAFEWAFESLLEGGITTGAGTVAKYEFSIMREMLMGVELADTFSVGVTVSQNWEPVGLLPNDAVTEENTNGAANFLVVNVVK